MIPSGDPRMDRLQALLHWSVPLGRVAGIPIRIYWTAGLLFAVSASQWAQWSGVGILEAMAWAGATTAVLYLVILTHELGHAFAARRVGAPVHRITLSVFGGLAHASAALPGPKAEIRVAAAGPAVHLLWLGVAWLLGRVVAPIPIGDFARLDATGYLFVLNLYLLGFNLLPLYPMDGGRILRGLLALRRHPNEATLWACRVGVVGGVAIAAWGLSRSGFGGGVLFLIGLQNVMTCVREMTVVRYSDGPYGPALDPWETDPDAWKAGRSGRSAPREERLWPRVLKGRRRGSPRAEDEAKPASGAATATLDAPASRTPEEEAELDRLLERVGLVGLSGLEPAERDRLQSLSRRPRR